MHRSHYQWYPTPQQQAAAIAKLPYLAGLSPHQRVDSRKPLVCTYVRRPSYYAAFNTGQIQTDQQRFGLGLVWDSQDRCRDPVADASDDFAGMRKAGAYNVYEAADLTAAYVANGNEIVPRPGASDLPAGVLVIR